MGLRPSRPLRGRQTRCLRQPYRCRVSGHSPAHPTCSFLVLPRPSGQLMLLEHQRAWALDRWTQKVRLPDLRLAISNGHGLALRPECLPHSFQPRQQTGSSRPAERLSGEGCWVEALSAPGHGTTCQPLGVAAWTSSRVRPTQVGSGGGSVWQRCALVQPPQRGLRQSPPGSQESWPPAGAGGSERGPEPRPPRCSSGWAGMGRTGPRPSAKLSGAWSTRFPCSPPLPARRPINQ